MATQRRELAERQRQLAGRDPVLDRLAEMFGPARLRGPARGPDRFSNLARAIAYQQLNGRAAATIWRRVLDRLDGECSPAAVLGADPDDLRAAGLSGSKVRALRDLAEHVDDGRLALASLGRLRDDEVVERITAVWGLGRWSAHMFMMSSLGRLDVWPVDDYGVRSGFARAWGLAEVPSPAALEVLGSPFAGARSLVAWYCWATVDDPAGAA